MDSQAPPDRWLRALCSPFAIMPHTKSLLIDLPPELRDMVYSEHLQLRPEVLSDPANLQLVAPGFSVVCKQVRSEMAALLASRAQRVSVQVTDSDFSRLLAWLDRMTGVAFPGSEVNEDRVVARRIAPVSEHQIIIKLSWTPKGIVPETLERFDHWIERLEAFAQQGVQLGIHYEHGNTLTREHQRYLHGLRKDGRCSSQLRKRVVDEVEMATSRWVARKNREFVDQAHYRLKT